MSHLFDPFVVRDRTFANRIFVSPMCQYSCEGGLANDWHLVHLGSRAVGGAGLVLTEATAVVPEGRISPEDLGLWSEAHADALARIVRFVQAQGTFAGVQLAHAGRKASTWSPWAGKGEVPGEQGGWETVAPSGIAFADDFPEPRALDEAGIARVVGGFRDAAARALDAGFDVIEIHAAHGYLLHEFLSPLSNQRTDRYGGDFDNRVRIVTEVTDAIRQVWPERLPLFLRLSATDWVEGGWTLEESIELARRVRTRGVDLIDCSSGGLVANAPISVGTGYQVGFAAEIRRGASIATGAVGMITSPAQADTIVRSGQADAVFLARELLRDPYWPLRAARTLRHDVPWPPQYVRAASSTTPLRQASGVPSPRRSSRP